MAGCGSMVGRSRGSRGHSCIAEARRLAALVDHNLYVVRHAETPRNTGKLLGQKI